MMEAEQYLLWESLIALSTSDGFRSLPRTTKCMWIVANTLGSISAGAVLRRYSQAETSCPLFLSITTASYAVHPPVPASTVSIGRAPTLRPPPSGAPSITKEWPLSVSATKLIPSGPIHFTLHSISRFLPVVAPGECSKRAQGLNVVDTLVLLQ